MRNSVFLAAVAYAAVSCSQITPSYPETVPVSLDKEGVARMLSCLQIGAEQMREVHDAVCSSAGGGYDEEYTLDRLFNCPGAGIGTKGGSYSVPMRDLITDWLSGHPCTKSAGEAERLVDELTRSGYQIYWPFSEDWDGETLPVITFDPGFDLDSNYGFLLRRDAGGSIVADSVYVDENLARERPVWVINSNTDAGFTPLDLYFKDNQVHTELSSRPRRLMLKSFQMLRNYDNWFQGASEFFIKMGAVDGFTASTEAELKLYSPNITDFMLVVRRKDLRKVIEYDAIMLTNYTSQMDKIAFLVTEDDGGTITSWKCEATVKVQSKSYGFSLDIPYNEKDDIVWRGQLVASFFQEEDEVSGRFGDVVITFALE